MNNRTKYSYNDFIEVLNEMYDGEKVANGNLINWIKLESDTIDSIIEKLYTFENDTQRSGFLNSIINKFFNDGKDYNITLVNKGISAFENELDYKYANNCRLVLNAVIAEVSDHCSVYDNVDFPKILERNFTVFEVDKFEPLSPYELFSVSSKQPYKENVIKNRGREPKSNDFRQYFDENVSDEFIEHVKDELKGTQGIYTAQIIIALKELINFKYKPLTTFFSVLKNEVGVTGERYSVSKYIFDFKDLDDNRTSPTRSSVQKMIDKLNQYL